MTSSCVSRVWDMAGLPDAWLTVPNTRVQILTREILTLWTHVTSGNFHPFSKAAGSPLHSPIGRQMSLHRTRQLFPVNSVEDWNKLPASHDDVIKWKHFPRYWPFVWGIHRSPVNSPHKGQWRGALLFSLICTRINGWVNNLEAGD